MMTTDLREILAQHPFCQGLDEDDVATLVGCARNVRFEDGELLMRQGEAATESFLIRHGRVRLVVQGGHAVETAEEGDLIGWSWLFAPYNYAFDAMAAGRVRAFGLDGACLRNKCEVDPRFGFQLTQRILHQATRRLEHSRLQAMDVYR